MEFELTDIPGCYKIIPHKLSDRRGMFVKTFNKDLLYSLHHLQFDMQEEYFSISKKNVLRGMHFQLPPFEHKKIVYCLQGKVLDVLVDLRIGSPVYGQPIIFNLDDVNNSILFIPIGVAHGFYTLSDEALLVYKTSTVYNSSCDTGISWKSFDIWPTLTPILSERDEHHPLLANFNSPFKLVNL